ncbi:MAG: endonuclease domain-containing protein [Asticcacaulis sp.]|nr:endonuclease domain-containing protein [Asticcacaulis sp.]
MEKRKYALARQFRRNLTDAEVLIWARLKGKPDGLHFRRQHPVGPYITDFYCASARLVIEIDGQVHDDDDVAIRDARRTVYLEKQGLIVCRITGVDVMYDPDEVARQVIEKAKLLRR